VDGVRADPLRERLEDCVDSQHASRACGCARQVSAGLLTTQSWVLAVIGATMIGVGKAGFSGTGILHVLIFAFIFGARESTGIVLPMLLVGDVGAVTAFHQHARWDYLRRMLPPACIGVIVGAAVMRSLNDAAFKPLIGWITLALAVVQLVRTVRPGGFARVPHTRSFAWAMGLLAGATTMLANSAGPVVALYCMAVGLPKFELVGTSAWFFFIVNAFKVPFSFALGLIHGRTLVLNLALTPAVIAGLFVGRWLVRRLPQKLFDGMLLAFAVAGALRLIGVF
jgi:uncharacterized membrane protein YfcA